MLAQADIQVFPATRLYLNFQPQLTFPDKAKTTCSFFARQKVTRLSVLRQTILTVLYQSGMFGFHLHSLQPSMVGEDEGCNLRRNIALRTLCSYRLFKEEPSKRDIQWKKWEFRYGLILCKFKSNAGVQAATCICHFYHLHFKTFYLQSQLWLAASRCFYLYIRHNLSFLPRRSELCQEPNIQIIAY